MPGISFVGGPMGPDETPLACLRGVCFRDEYERTVHLADDSAVLASTGYPAYPVETVETDDTVLLLEGHLYDAADERRHLRSVGRALREDRPDAVASWLADRDGDFLVAAYDRATGALSLVNDRFGRLPVYYATVGDDPVVSRELKFVRDLAARRGDPLDPDPMAFAQTLLLGYRLGDRTLFESVRRVPPGSYVRIDDGVRVRSLHRHDFGTAVHADRSVGENARELAARFERACANRDLDGLPNVLSLSGGLDSRAVGGGYAAAGASFAAATYEWPDGSNAADVRIARRVADALDADWERYPVERAAAHRRELLTTKQGQNHLGMSFLLDFLDQLRKRHGPFAYVTGDGGDKALPDLTPPRSFDSRRDLAEYLAAAHAIFDPDEAAALAGVSRDSLVRAVEARLASYPETSYDDLYVHFLVRERCLNWLTHGEDRNRYYCWSVSPFYAPDFFEYAANVPADQKAGNGLYAAFLDELDPALVGIDDANYDAPVTSLRHRLKQFGVDLVYRYPRLKRTLASLFDGATGDELADALERQFRRADATPLSDPVVEQVVRNVGRYDGHELYNLLTLLATAGYEADRGGPGVSPRHSTPTGAWTDRSPSEPSGK
jgi:asparagine synthase (glutamine-hydrolysing)